MQKKIVPGIVAILIFILVLFFVLDYGLGHSENVTGGLVIGKIFEPDYSTFITDSKNRPMTKLHPALYELVIKWNGNIYVCSVSSYVYSFFEKGSKIDTLRFNYGFFTKWGYGLTVYVK